MEQLGFQGPNRGGGGLVVDNSTVTRVISCGSFGLSLNLYFFSVSSLIGSRNTSFSAKKKLNYYNPFSSQVSISEK